jgi:hypothetical protein
VGSAAALVVHDVDGQSRVGARHVADIVEQFGRNE